ncbi:MAG: hypothetical protein EOM24_28155 [Chloroflexia bacterium]|nr:hypothetical protein [Chloroflexia bacterium]
MTILTQRRKGATIEDVRHATPTASLIPLCASAPLRLCVKQPAIIVMDGAAGWGKTRAEVQTRSDGQTSLVAPVPQSGGSDPARLWCYRK